MAEEFDKPLGAPKKQEEKKKGTEHEIHTTKKPLNWRGFIIGIIIVLFIEWFAVKALSGDDPKVLPSIIPSNPPSPTVTQKETEKWGKYTDEKTGFTLLYPADTYLLETATAEKQNTLRIQTFDIKDQEKYLAEDFQPNEYQNLLTAIQKGTEFSSLQPGKKDNYKTIQFGSNYFVRIFPIESPKCDCDVIRYVTTVYDNYVVISMEKPRIYNLPPIKEGDSPDEMLKKIKADAKKQMETEPEKYIQNHFGPIEKVLATFKKI